MNRDFGSNILPRKFGRGKELTDWRCFCGAINKRYLVQCKDCGIKREHLQGQEEQIESTTG